MPCLMKYPGKVKAGTLSAREALYMHLTATMLVAAVVKLMRPLNGEDLLGPSQPRAVFWRYKRMENRRKAVRRGSWKMVVDNGKEPLFHRSEDPEEKVNRVEQAGEEPAAWRGLLRQGEADVNTPLLQGFH